LKYLNNVKNYKLYYVNKGKILEYSNSDYTGDLNVRKLKTSVHLYVFKRYYG